jgi:hypothetical protein
LAFFSICAEKGRKGRKEPPMTSIFHFAALSTSAEEEVKGNALNNRQQKSSLDVKLNKD